ncbi:MAG: hypothetical protein J07HX64_00925 [halophilic archaeon J07HX64]|nr:MAG: hypothetical protein J07HX64_00925 [halophilic archaeon J07HX64]
MRTDRVGDESVAGTNHQFGRINSMRCAQNG